jgi:hypothetical protein
MATVSKGGRSYSDPSYGSVKAVTLGPITAGTRPTEVAFTFKTITPITVIDWKMVNSALGTGGSSQWKLSATSGAGTSTLGTLSFAGTHGVGAMLEATVSETNVAAGGAVNLYSVLSTAANLALTAVVQYRERFVVTDN